MGTECSGTRCDIKEAGSGWETFVTTFGRPRQKDRCEIKAILATQKGYASKASKD